MGDSSVCQRSPASVGSILAWSTPDSASLEESRTTRRRDAPWRSIAPSYRIWSLTTSTRSRAICSRATLESWRESSPCWPPDRPASPSRRRLSGLGRVLVGLAMIGRGPLHGLLTLIERLLPHAILIENVPGFVKGNRSALPILEERLAAVNCRSGTRYRLACRVLNAAEFGVPQRRRRAIVIAFRSGADPIWPAATHHDRPVRAWDALHDVSPTTPPAPSGRFAGLLRSIPEGQNYQFFTERGEGPALFGYRCRYWSFLLKLAKAEPAWTVPANPGPATGALSLGQPSSSTRRDSPATDFPRAHGGSMGLTVSKYDKPATRLLLCSGRFSADQSQHSSTGRKARGGPMLAIARSEFVPPPTPHRPVADEYMALAGHHDPHPGEGCGPRPRSRQSDESQNESDDSESGHIGVQ